MNPRGCESCALILSESNDNVENFKTVDNFENINNDVQNNVDGVAADKVFKCLKIFVFKMFNMLMMLKEIQNVCETHGIHNP